MESNNQSSLAKPPKHVVTQQEFSAKFSSKPEVYRFLAFEVGAFLPPYDNVTVHHLRDLAGGRRLIIKSDSVRSIHVPHFEGLTTDTMLFHAKNFPGVVKALPLEPREVDKLPRSYIANLIYTIVGDPFKCWVNEKIQDRSKKILEE